MGAEQHVIAAVGLGSNVGDRAAHLTHALIALAGMPNTRLLVRSSIIQTDAVGAPGGGDPGGAYLNAAAILRTTLEPRALLDCLHEIERTRGRDRAGEASRWLPRTLDLDLLLFGDRVLDEPGLVVPHPRMHEREFVLLPLAEVGPDLFVPTMRSSVADLLARLKPGSIPKRKG